MSTSPPDQNFESQELLAGFIESHRPQLMTYIQRSLGPELRQRLEPEDILQEVTVTAVSSFDQFNQPGRVPFKLLCQMCEQKIIDAHRFHFAGKRDAEKLRQLDGGGGGGKSEHGGLIDWLAASITSPSKAFSRSERELRLQQAIAELTDVQREALQLRYVEGMSTKEVAERLGKSDGAVRVLLTRTVADLQGRLMESG